MTKMNVGQNEVGAAVENRPGWSCSSACGGVFRGRHSDGPCAINSNDGARTGVSVENPEPLSETHHGLVLLRLRPQG